MGASQWAGAFAYRGRLLAPVRRMVAQPQPLFIRAVRAVAAAHYAFALGTLREPQVSRTARGRA